MRKDALAGDWRRANEETGLALPDHDDRLALGRGRSQLHHGDDDRRDCDRRYRVHHNTELAVVGVSRVRVLVRYLSYDKHRQKNKAQNRNRRQNAMPGAAFSAEICLKSSQSIVSVPSIFYRRTHLIGRQRRKGVARLFFAANADSPDSSKLCCHGWFCANTGLGGDCAGSSAGGVRCRGAKRTKWATGPECAQPEQFEPGRCEPEL